MKTPSAIILAIGLIASSLILSNGLGKLASAIIGLDPAIRSAGGNFMRGDFTVKVKGDQREPLYLEQKSR